MSFLQILRNCFFGSSCLITFDDFAYISYVCFDVHNYFNILAYDIELRLLYLLANK